MVLCFGTLANILILCSLPGTTNRSMVATLVGTIDPDNQYGDKNNDTPVYRLMSCISNFPTVKVEAGSGAVRSNGGSLTNIIALSRSVSPAELALRFDPVVDLLDEDKKRAAVGALHYLIQTDDSLEGNHRDLFVKCTGDTATHIVKADEVDLHSFLARLFLYTVLINENTKGKADVKEIRNGDLIRRCASYQIALSKAAPATSETNLLDGRKAYLKGLVEKYNRIPSILFKEALSPFTAYYVPNDVEWHEPVPNQRMSYYVRRINGRDVSTLLKVSRYLVLSGTGGLGKSMMMRNFALSSAETYEKTGILPFFVPLKDYEATFATMLDYVFSSITDLWPELTVEKLEAILKSGKALLLFDGLDEIHTSKLTDFTKKMNSFQDRYSQNAFVISSRPYSNFLSFTRSTVLRLQPFTKTQALELIDRYNYRSDAPSLQARFRLQFENELFSTHKGFSDNPLLLSIMMLTFEMDAEVPLQKHLFYQEAYTVLSRRHDALKDGYNRKLSTGWNSNRFADYFAFFCATTYNDGKVSFTYTLMEQYFQKMAKKYHIQDVTVDDFIYDLINNLCLMYQDGLNYGFIHRSFQEYFCAKYFNAQLDELLTHVIPVFDRNDTTKKGDSAIEMLFDMKPKAVEKYLIIPYLKGLIDDCEKNEGIWTFLDRLYDGYEMADGVAVADDDYAKPRSNLYGFIIDHYKIDLLTPCTENLPGIDYFTESTMVYREDTSDDVWKEDLPSDYIEYYGEPEETGHIFSIDWMKAHSEVEAYPYLLGDFVSAVENPSSPFMKEYSAIKELLRSLEEKATEKPTSSSLFDLME